MNSTAGTQIFNKPIQKAEITPDLNGLQPFLQKLDQLIIQAKEKAESSETSLEQLSIKIRSDSHLSWLTKTFNLSTFDLYILTIALAPELDKQYERVYTYLQDDISNKRPTVDLVFNLLCSSISEKLSRRKHFSTNSPLIHHHLLHLSSEATLLSQQLILDSQVIRFLLSQPGLDSRLTSYCQLLESIPSAEFIDNLYLKEDLQNKLQTIVKEDWQKQPLLLYFQGIDSLGQRRTAQVLAQTLEVPLLVADLGKILEDKPNFESNLQLLFREAWFFNRLLYIDNFDILNLQENQVYLSTFLKQLENNRSITILAGVQNWIPTATAKGVITIPFTIPDSSQRRECWKHQLQAAEINIEEKELDILSNRFRLTPDQIADTVTTAYNNARWQSNTTAFNQIFNNLCSAARSQSGHNLTTLARKVEPKYTWNDIILHPNQLKQLRDICKEGEYQNLVHQQWGFADKLSLGKGLNVLFSGSPGTGKTMAAEVIAAHLQLDLYKIDLSQIVSKYIGDTEKNLNRIFTAAANSNAILLFDEADALFGKRSEVQDARDRYANIEVGHLLQKMEEYEGIAILTTNARSNMDEAFERRLRFIIEFQLPGSTVR